MAKNDANIPKSKNYTSTNATNSESSALTVRQFLNKNDNNVCVHNAY